MVPSFKNTNWQVGIVQPTGMIQIRVQEDDEFRDYWVPNDPANSDYQQYLEWKAEGNTPKILFS